jgi:tubulin delta
MLNPLRAMVEKAFAMYSSKAFVHQYANHGVDAEFFDSCFLRVDQIVTNYESI